MVRYEFLCSLIQIQIEQNVWILIENRFMKSNSPVLIIIIWNQVQKTFSRDIFWFHSDHTNIINRTYWTLSNICDQTYQQYAKTTYMFSSISSNKNRKHRPFLTFINNGFGTAAVRCLECQLFINKKKNAVKRFVQNSFWQKNFHRFSFGVYFVRRIIFVLK